MINLLFKSFIKLVINHISAITITKENAVIIVVVASIVSVSLIGILLIVKKRK